MYQSIWNTFLNIWFWFFRLENWWHSSKIAAYYYVLILRLSKRFGSYLTMQSSNSLVRWIETHLFDIWYIFWYQQQSICVAFQWVNLSILIQYIWLDFLVFLWAFSSWFCDSYISDEACKLIVVLLYPNLGWIQWLTLEETWYNLLINSH